MPSSLGQALQFSVIVQAISEFRRFPGERPVGDEGYWTQMRSSVPTRSKASLVSMRPIGRIVSKTVSLKKEGVDRSQSHTF